MNTENLYNIVKLNFKETKTGFLLPLYTVIDSNDGETRVWYRTDKLSEAIKERDFIEEYIGFSDGKIDYVEEDEGVF